MSVYAEDMLSAIFSGCEDGA